MDPNGERKKEKTLTKWHLPLGLALLLALLQSGCSGGGGSACSRICTWIAGCYSSAGLTAPTCPLSNTCATHDQCKIDCYDRSSCDAVTKKSMAGYHQLQACLSQCGQGQDLGPGKELSVFPEGIGPPPEGGPPFDLPHIPDMPSPDELSPDQPSVLLPFGSICTNSSQCESGLECVFIKGTTSGNSFCTKICYTRGQQCTGEPSGTMAGCILADSTGTKYYCVFICYLNGTQYSCPSSGMTCLASHATEAGVVMQKVCIP